MRTGGDEGLVNVQVSLCLRLRYFTPLRIGGPFAGIFTSLPRARPPV